MKADGEWRELDRRDDLHSAGVIVTSIAAMEFDVVLRDVSTGRLVADSSGAGVIEDPSAGPFSIEVRAEDWSDLQDVLEEIIDEQGAFDALIKAREHKMRRARRGFLLLAIVLIATVLLFLLSR